MATYVFQDRVLACGTLKMRFITNDGDATAYNVFDNFLLKVGKRVDAVEETGIGGVIRVSNLSIEIYDRNGIFRTTIFNRLVVTNVIARLTLIVSGTEYEFFYGKVDLNTVSYPSIYQQADVEEHTCKFIVFSLLRDLETKTIDVLKTNVDARSVEGTLGGSDHYWFVKLLDVLDEIQKLIFTSPAYPSVVLTETFTNVTDSYTRDIADVYLMFADGSNIHARPFDLMFDPTGGADPPKSNNGCFQNLSDCRTLLEKIASQLLAYPFLVFTPSSGFVSDSIQLKLKQRSAGSLVSLGNLKSSTLHSFAGYDAIRVSSMQDYGGVGYANTYITPSNVLAAGFELVKQKYDYQSYLTLHQGGHNALFVKDIHFEVASITPFERDWNLHLSTAFTSYWTNPAMYERVYEGVGIGTVELLDQISIDGANCTLIAIERDIVANEMQIKAVKY